MFVRYYDEPIMTKVKNEGNFSIYMCKLNTKVSNETRYIGVIVPMDAFIIGDTQQLRNLKWVAFQTRSFAQAYPMIKRTHFYVPKQIPEFQTAINQVFKNGNEAIYTSPELPFKITLLYAKNTFYPEKGTLISALETYNTIVEWIQK